MLTFMVKGESHSKYGPQYVHFQCDCLKEYAHRKHDLSYEEFPFAEIKVDQKTLQGLSNDDKSNLKEYGLINMNWDIEKFRLPFECIFW